ncbi:ribosome-recycling factor, mitochondrial-like isoform X2 [Mizuhopecten yessoensis]|nr:ribosome-recycling factor, mitochondrial-like isoform X2 [Mizuhopecten yessoensis]XP_021355472.1 ribosome-recycling factor, mitochondrial-like isoform X2 [Mizuhopecten yessoensis]
MSRTLSSLFCIPRLVTFLSRPLHSGGLSQVCSWHGYRDLNRKSFHSMCFDRQGTAWHGLAGSTGALLSPDNYTLSYCQRRGKAKGKVKGKKDKKSKPDKQDADDDEDADPLKKYKDQLEWQYEHLKEQYISQLGLRTSLSSYENVAVTINKSQTVPLNQLAQVIQKTPQLMQINMAASPQYLKEIKTALMESALNVNPQQEGTSLFINLPKVTREHRETLASNAQRLYNDAKQQMNQFQNKQLRKAKTSQDKEMEVDIRKLYETYIKKSEEIMKRKQKELTG